MLLALGLAWRGIAKLHRSALGASCGGMQCGGMQCGGMQWRRPLVSLTISAAAALAQQVRASPRHAGAPHSRWGHAAALAQQVRACPCLLLHHPFLNPFPAAGAEGRNGRQTQWARGAGRGVRRRGAAERRRGGARPCFLLLSNQWPTVPASVLQRRRGWNGMAKHTHARMRGAARQRRRGRRVHEASARQGCACNRPCCHLQHAPAAWALWVWGGAWVTSPCRPSHLQGWCQRHG